MASLARRLRTIEDIVAELAESDAWQDEDDDFLVEEDEIEEDENEEY
jgi:hypothetical protein